MKRVLATFAILSFSIAGSALACDEYATKESEAKAPAEATKPVAVAQKANVKKAPLATPAKKAPTTAPTQQAIVTPVANSVQMARN